MIFLESLCKISTVVPGIKVVKFLKKKKIEEKLKCCGAERKAEDEEGLTTCQGHRAHTLPRHPAVYMVWFGFH